MIDAKMVALMTETETLLEERDIRQELLAEEKKRRLLLKEGYTFNMSIQRETAALEAEVESRSGNRCMFIHPRTTEFHGCAPKEGRCGAALSGDTAHPPSTFAGWQRRLTRCPKLT